MRNPCCCCKSYTASNFILKTLVADYADPPGDDIAPYPRCGTVDGDACPNSCGGGSGEIPCGVWPFAMIPADAGAYSYFHEGNQFNASETPAASVTICDEPGHKTAQTIKQWHGRLPFDHCDHACAEVTVKYRTIQMVARAEYTGSVTDTADYDIKWSIDRYSGKATKPTCDHTYTGNPANEEQVKEFARHLAAQRWGLTWDEGEEECADAWVGQDEPTGGEDIIEYNAKSIARSVQDTLNGTPPSGAFSVTSSSTSATELSFHVSIDYGGGDTLELSGTITLSDGYTPSQVRTDADAALAYWLFGSNLLFPWRSDTLRSVGVIARYNELAVRSPELGNSTCVTLDDYRSPIGSPPYTSWDQMAWIDLDAYVWVTGTGTSAHETNPATEAADELRLRYDGSIIGQPFKSGTPTGLPDKMFSWTHITWACWTDPAEHWEARRHGAYAGENSTGIDASDLLVPKSAPLWTENYPAGFLYWGSWVKWNGTDSLEMQKQIELTQAFDAYNRFGPCGYHRHSPDVSKSSCVNSYDGSSVFAEGDILTLDDAIGDGTYNAVIFGGANTPKIFEVAVTGTSCVIGAEDTNARGVADAVAFWLDVPGMGTGNGIVAKVRDWQRSGVSFAPPAICGKIRILTATDNHDGTFNLTLADEAKYLQIGDLTAVVESDAADTLYDDNSGAGFDVAAVIGDTEFTFNGTFDAAFAGKYLKILDAPLAKFNSTTRRRQFCYQEWLNDSTTGDFLDDSGATSPIITDDSYTGEKILGSTPNVATDTETKWKTDGLPTAQGYPFPTTPTPTNCGGERLVVPIQYVTDPLYQTPYSCGDAVAVCPPKVEAITAQRLIDEGAPALPDGCTFAFPGVPAGQGTDCGTGMPNGWSSPWSLCTPV